MEKIVNTRYFTPKQGFRLTRVLSFGLTATLAVINLGESGIGGNGEGGCAPNKLSLTCVLLRSPEIQPELDALLVTSIDAHRH
jgi:hypothetical protein